jgi:hypothetical protein
VTILKSISLENFKAVKHPIKISFNPITLLFGPNSAGKSTIIQSLIYAREIFVHRNLDPHQCEIAGEHIDLGGFQNLVHNHDLSLPIIIDLELSLDQEELPSYTEDDDWLDLLQAYSGQSLDCLKNVRAVSVRVVVRWDSRSSSPFVESYRVMLNDEEFCEIESWDFGGRLEGALSDQGKGHLIEEQPRLKELLKDVTRSINSRINLQHSLFSVVDEADQTTNLLARIANSLLMNPESQSFLDTRGRVLPDWEIPIRYSGKPKEQSESDLDTHEYWSVAKGFDELLSRSVVGPGKMVRDALGKFTYLGPLRAIPPRALEQGQLRYEGSYRGGINVWEALFHIDEQKLHAINDWVSSKKKLNTGYSIDRMVYREFDEKLMSDLEAQRFAELIEAVKGLPERVRLRLKQEASGLELSFQDVGTGISQVLPVVIAAITSPDGILAIEQPELHIHPALQVILGDLFISRIQDKDSPLILLETHSEHLLLRIMRRMRETYEGRPPEGIGPIGEEDVAVYFVESDKSQTIARQMPLNERGELVKAWPGGFFEEGLREVFS